MAWGRPNDDIDDLFNAKIKKHGEHFPKKHGDWYRVKAYDNYWLILDTWNQQVYLHKGFCTPGSTNNMYQVVYAFSGGVGAVPYHMRRFWMAHIN